jgi:pyridoxamine 5'-phosphate oxidase
MSTKTVLTPGQGFTAGIPHEADNANPIELFQEWFEAAKQSETLLPDAASLATASTGGIPSARMVLLKHVDNSGFVFYTNYGSQKARELDENPHAAMCIHWPLLQQQVRISGPVELVDTEESATYFATRSRGSQIGAWASSQSEPLGSRAILEARVQEVQERFEDGEAPLPTFWGGYRIKPERIEFWQGRSDRLHDRLTFSLNGAHWTSERLYP